MATEVQGSTTWLATGTFGILMWMMVCLGQLEIYVKKHFDFTLERDDDYSYSYGRSVEEDNVPMSPSTGGRILLHIYNG